MNRDDFYVLNKDIVYLDNGATTLKPYILGESIIDYYNNYSANAHRGDYNLSLKEILCMKTQEIWLASLLIQNRQIK